MRTSQEEDENQQQDEYGANYDRDVQDYEFDGGIPEDEDQIKWQTYQDREYLFYYLLSLFH